MMPHYPARDGHLSMFTLDDDAGAIVGPIRSTIRTSGSAFRLPHAELGTLRASRLDVLEPRVQGVTQLTLASVQGGWDYR
jgi:hypothetical protein